MTLLDEFLAEAPPGTARSLAVLACAESLTDAVAEELYRLLPLDGLEPTRFIAAFKYSGFTEPRNSEWNLLPPLRRQLIDRDILTQAEKATIHRALVDIATAGDRAKAGSEIPAYLFTEGGLAYHLAGAGQIKEALYHYGEASRGTFTGAQWLGARLAEEQERRRILPQGAIETTFLRAIVLLRDGQRKAAMPLFRRVAATDQVRREVAISLHLIGNDHNRGQRRGAEAELQRGVEIAREIGDLFGVAQIQHSLANFLSRQDGRFAEAEAAYNESIATDRALGNDFGVAQALHSLANLLGKHDSRFADAEAAYRESLALGELLDQRGHVAQTSHSLANLLGRREDRWPEAEAAYRQSVAIDRALEDHAGEAKTLHSFGSFIARQPVRADEAEAMLNESVAISRRLNRQEFSLAQTLHSLANLLSRQSGRAEDAERFYQESLKLGEQLRHDDHRAQVLRSYGLMVAPRSISMAIDLLERSLRLNQRRGNRRFARIVKGDLRRLRGLSQGDDGR